MSKQRLDFDAVRELALELPDVVDATGARGPAFKAHGKLLACAAIHSSAEEGSLAVRFDPSLRASLLAAEPDIYYVTPHYEPYPMVLVRLSRVHPDALTDLVTGAWRLASAADQRRRSRRTPAARRPRR